MEPKRIVIERIGRPDTFRLSVDGVSAQFTEDELRSELHKQLDVHSKEPRDFAEKLIRDCGSGRIEVNFRDRPATSNKVGLP